MFKQKHFANAASSTKVQQKSVSAVEQRIVTTHGVIGKAFLPSSIDLLGNSPLKGIQRQVILGQFGQIRGNKVLREFLGSQRHMITQQISAPNVQRHLMPRRNIVIQKWDSPEHVKIGDLSASKQKERFLLDCHKKELPERTRPVEEWPSTRSEFISAYRSGSPAQKDALTKGLTYGEIVALSGDFYSSYEDLNRASLLEVIRLIPLIRDGGTTEQKQAATAGRYLALAEENESHFSTAGSGQNNLETWRTMHADAIRAARQGNKNEAWVRNAAADHFLTDAFSGGHVRTPRSKLMANDFQHIESAILHNLDNKYGVEVNNKRGDIWIAFGDLFLSDPRNRANKKLMLEAVDLSRQDVQNAIDNNGSYPEPNSDTRFEAEKLIPNPVDPERDRWTRPIPGSRVPSDYSEMRGELILEEGPSFIGGLFTSNDQICEWVGERNPSVIGRQPIKERLRMINALLDGWVTDNDLNMIRRICHSNPADLPAIRAAIAPRAAELISFRQRWMLRQILGGI